MPRPKLWDEYDTDIWVRDADRRFLWAAVLTDLDEVLGHEERIEMTKNPQFYFLVEIYLVPRWSVMANRAKETIVQHIGEAPEFVEGWTDEDFVRDIVSYGYCIPIGGVFGKTEQSAFRKAKRTGHFNVDRALDEPVNLMGTTGYESIREALAENFWEITEEMERDRFSKRVHPRPQVRRSLRTREAGPIQGVLFA